MSQSHESQAEDMEIDSNENVATTAQNESIAGPSDSIDNILVRLNADCIMKVFEHLPLRDLCNSANVCRTFQSIAVSVFKRRHSDFDFDQLLDSSDSEDDSDTESHYPDTDDESDNGMEWNSKHMKYKPPADGRRARALDMETVKNLFRHFGASMKSIDLTVRDEDQQSEILELILTFCTDEDAKLTKLKMCDVTVRPDLLPHMQQMYDRIEILRITGGSISPFHIGSKLTELTLEEVYIDGTFTRQCEKLKALTLIDVEENSPGNFQSLLSMATELKRLNMRDTTVDCYVLPAQLEELELYYDSVVIKDIVNLAHLHYLKVLTLDCLDSSMAELFNNFVEQNVPIEELYLRNLTLDIDTVTSLSGLSKVKILSLAVWPDNGKLSNVVQGMPVLEKLHLETAHSSELLDVIKSTIENAPKLKEFQIYLPYEPSWIHYQKFILGASDYNVIGQLIRKRPDQTKLTLELTGIEVEINAPENIIQRNRALLQTTVITFKDVQPVNIIDYYGFSDDSETSETSDDSD